MIDRVFRVCDRAWRGIGVIPQSGFTLTPEFRDYDAEQIFDVQEIHASEPAICISGEVLRGLKKPHDCPAFGKLCTPENPLGATMVSAEGACAAYYNYGRHLVNAASLTRPDRKWKWKKTSSWRALRPSPIARTSSWAMAAAAS